MASHATSFHVTSDALWGRPRHRRCNVVTRAAGKLADLGDTRAIEHLRELAQRKGLLGLVETCEAPAARAALKKLEKR